MGFIIHRGCSFLAQNLYEVRYIVDLVLSEQMRLCDVSNRSTLDKFILQNKI